MTEGKLKDYDAVELLANLSDNVLDDVKRGTLPGTDQVFRFDGATILIFGDPHLSAVFKGSHKNYRDNCVHNIGRWLSIVQEEVNSGNKVIVIFLGDLIGVKERHLVRDHNFRRYVYMFLRKLNGLCEMVASVRGNHDLGVDDPEFAILETLGLITNPSYIDIYNKQGTALELRLHLVNYGNARSIQFNLDTGEHENVTHIALGHNDYQIPGRNDFYGTSDNSIDVTTLNNFKGIDFLIFGDIHHPFDDVEQFSLTVEPNKLIHAYCPGSPSRTSSSEDFQDCFYVKFALEGTNTDYNLSIEPFGALPPEVVFLEKNNLEELEEALADDDDAETKERNARLSELITNINSTNLHLGDPRSQILDRAKHNPRAGKIALEYFDAAVSGATLNR